MTTVAAPVPAGTPGPLTGVRVLDLTRLLPGGVLTALLGDLGAEVIKVEEPTAGDYMRWESPKTGEESAASWIVGRNKRSIGIDLKAPEGVELFLSLAETTHVVIEGFRPGIVDRLGVGFEAARARNPRIVYASLTGYGSDGPMRDVAGHDINYISYAGVLGMTGPPGGPVCPPGVQVSDLGGATILGIGLLSALYASAVTGIGSRVEVAMYDAALAWTSIHAGEYWASGSVPDPGKTLLNGRYPCYNVYACSDGKFLSLGAVERKFWANFCEAVGRPDLIPRHSDESARGEVAALIATKPRDVWAAQLEHAEACAAPVLDLGEALAHPMASGRHMIRQARLEPDSPRTALTLGAPIRMNGQARPTGTPPPRLGADTQELASEAGLSPERIADLVSRGVLAIGRAR